MDNDEVHLIRGQPVPPESRERARGLRREMTEAEKVLWRELRSRQLFGLKFRRQQPIANYIADFYCADARLVVEADGPVHDGQQEYDKERSRVLQAHGLTVLRLPNDMIINALPEALALIAAHCLAPYSPSPVGEGAGG